MNFVRALYQEFFLFDSCHLRRYCLKTRARLQAPSYYWESCRQEMLFLLNYYSLLSKIKLLVFTH